MEYVLIVAALLLLLYGFWFFKNILKSGRARKMHREYQSLLDQKLKPLGFEKKETLVGGRERIAFYKRNALEFTLSYEISFDANSMIITNSRKSKSIDLTASDDTKNNVLQTLEEWLAENK